MRRTTPQLSPTTAMLAQTALRTSRAMSQRRAMSFVANNPAKADMAVRRRRGRGVEECASPGFGELSTNST